MNRLNNLRPYLLSALVIGLLISVYFLIPGQGTMLVSLLFFASLILIPLYLGFGPGMFFMLASLFTYIYFFTKPGHTLLIGWPRFFRLLIAIAQFSIIIFLAYRYGAFRRMKTSSEKRFRSLIESSKNAIVLLNEKGKKLYASPAITSILGYTPEEFMNIPALSPDYHFQTEHAAEVFKFVLEHPSETRTVTHKFKHKKGHYVFLETTITNSLNAPEVKAIILNIRDLTKQQTAEETALVQKNRLELINSIGRAVSADLDLHSILQRVTDATTKLSGAQFGAFFYNAITEDGEEYMLYTLSGAKREQFDKFGMPRNTAVFHPTFAGLHNVRVGDIKNDPTYGKNPPHYGMPKGHLPVTSYMAVPVKRKSGEVIGGLFFGHSEPDVFTEEAEELVSGIASQASIAIDNAKLFEEQKKLLEENERLLQLAGELNEKKDEFISIASHELKTPLTTAKAYVQLLEREIQEKHGDPKLAQYTTKAVSNVNKLQVLIEDLLNISKIQAGKMKYNMQNIPLMSIVNEAVESMTNTTTSHQIKLSGNSNAVVYADAQRLEQVLSNLLSNAMKYSPGANEVELCVTEEAQQVVVSVKDKGIGISENDKQKVFNRFERLNNDHRFSGLGIGLYLADEIIKRHNGDMWLESKVGEGSTFFFSLPKLN